VQPPGTPAVGQAYLRIHEITGDPAHFEAARLAAEALAYGQLESGGWHYMIDFDPQADPYLRRELSPYLSPKDREKRKNVTTFDDDNTQASARFLMAIVQAKETAKEPKRAERIQRSLDYALAGMLHAQYPNGAFPQGYTGLPRNPADHPAVKASIPDDWHTLPKFKDYWFHYTLNDNTHSDCLRTLLEAHRRFGDAMHLDAAKKAGDFLLLAQLPAPQPAWAQQYTFDMKPAWARKFEPPAVCSHESAGVVRALTDLYLHTGDDKYLAPIPAALDWLEKSKLPDGRWSRFYELGTNRPLYMTRDYQVVYTDNDLPTHYGFQGTYGIAAARKYYEDVTAAGREKWLARPKKSTVSDQKVADVIAALDEKGRWLKDGRIDSRAFVENVHVLCDYLAGRG
jgi:hypothetical protein